MLNCYILCVKKLSKCSICYAEFLFEFKRVYTLKTLERGLGWIKQMQKQQWKSCQ